MTESDFVDLLVIAGIYLVVFFAGYFALQRFIDWDFNRRKK